MKKTFSLIITGYGGQGVLAIAEIIARAAQKQGHESKESELHGLAQRGGSLDCHIRFGEKIYSPIVERGSADLIISLEALEALRACYWASKNTNFLVNAKTFNSPWNLDQITAKIKRFTSNIQLIDADSIVQKLTKDIVAANIFMLGSAIKKGLLPLKKEIVWQEIKARLHERFWDENEKVFEEAFR
jgi:indolepyruvate ferredoxin oxidoreductase beta subunit